jgi:hypothetical protein
MQSEKKQKKKLKKKIKNAKDVNNKAFTITPVITEEQKEFYLDQINSLEPRLIR